MQIAYLPLTLLLSAAVFSGATVLSIIIAIRAKREHDTTIFSMVRESEQLTIRRALAGTLFFLVLSASTIGGWAATQQNPNNVLIARQIAQPTETLAVAVVIATPPNTPAPQLLAPTETAPIPTPAQIINTPAPVEPAVVAQATVNVQEISSQPEAPDAPVDPTAPPVPAEPTTVPVEPEPTATPVPAEPTNTPAPEPTEAPAPAEIAAVTAVATETVDSAEPTPVPLGDEDEATANSAEPATAAGAVASAAKIQGSNISPIVFSTEVTDDRQAVSPQNTFNNKTERVYAVFSYNNMKNGTPFSTIWYFKGKEVLRDEFAWNWGPKDTSYTFIRIVGPGAYKVEIRVNNELQAEGTFEVMP